MTAHHQIDHNSKLITTFWDSNTADNKLIDSLKNYQKEIKNQEEVYSYNEIVDFSLISSIQLNVNEIIQLTKIASLSDSATKKTKLALIFGSNMAFSFGMMYKAYRNLLSKSNKEVNVFKNQAEALTWINKE